MKTLFFIAFTLAFCGNIWADTVPVAARAIAAGEVLEEGMFVGQEVPSNRLYAGTIRLATELVGMQAVRPLRAGEPINRLHIKPAVDVNRNSVVGLIYQRPGLRLMGSGTALDDGRIGDTVRVLNPESRATVRGVVVATNQVEVK